MCDRWNYPIVCNVAIGRDYGRDWIRRKDFEESFSEKQKEI